MNSNNYNQNPDWAKIRAEYVNGNSSLSDLADKYKVSKSAIQKRSASEKWGAERKKKAKKKADKVVEKLHEKDVKQTVKDIERCCKAAGKLIDKINKAISEVDKGELIETAVTKLENETGNKKLSITNKKSNIKRVDTLVNTKKISELSKSLLNIKKILTDIEDSAEPANSGIIEIPVMAVLEPPEELEEQNGAADEQ